MNPDVQAKLTQLVTELQHLYAEKLVSICAYGPALDDTYFSQLKQHHQSIQTLIILETLTPTDLEKASSIGKWWLKTAQALPTFMSKAEWLSSQDIYALEFADIRDTHYVAFGEDLYTPIQIESQALRLECEQECHRKLVNLRQGILLHRDKPRLLLETLQKNVLALMPLFRGIIRLHNPTETAPFYSGSVLGKLEELIEGFQAEPFHSTFQGMIAQRFIRLTDVSALYNQVLEQVELVTHHVDQFRQKQS